LDNTKGTDALDKKIRTKTHLSFYFYVISRLFTLNSMMRKLAEYKIDSVNLSSVRNVLTFVDINKSPQSLNIIGIHNWVLFHKRRIERVFCRIPFLANVPSNQVSSGRVSRCLID
jgi:hypothetical protein